MIPRYREEIIIDYKTSIGFRSGLERLGIVSYQYGYYITLSHFKTRHFRIELKEDTFTDYPEDQ